MKSVGKLCSANTVTTDHKDRLHDVSFDHYGMRMATCSSDQNVKIWDLDDNKEWKCTRSWKTHRASVWRVTWAHPEFGQVIATCSFDRTAVIWEETIVELPSGEIIHEWVSKANLVDSRTSVKDIKFSPRHLGLQLATCSANGVIRIYEAPDVMNLTQWIMQDQITCDVPCCCLSWNPSLNRIHNPMIAVGSDDWRSSSGGKVFIFEYNDSAREWSRIHTIMCITDPVNDVSFAPNIGCQHHVLAVASKDLHIFNLKPIDDAENKEDQQASAELNVHQVAQLTDHNCNVLRLSWNDLGTLLVSSGENGQVCLWMANYLNIWKCVNSLKPDNSKTSKSMQVLGGMQADGGYTAVAPFMMNNALQNST